jgi:hypothetical protein
MIAFDSVRTELLELVSEANEPPAAGARAVDPDRPAAVRRFAPAGCAIASLSRSSTAKTLYARTRITALAPGRVAKFAEGAA